MSKKLRLTKIELKTKDGKKVSLSLSEAKDLHDQLHDLFGKKETIFVPSPSPPPIIIERDRYPWRGPCTPYWRDDYIPMCWHDTGDPPAKLAHNTCLVECESGLKVDYVGEAV